MQEACSDSYFRSRIKKAEESVIRGHHVFKEIWTSEILSLVKPETLIDRRAVALLKVDRSVVGHVPREFSIGFS